MVKMIPRVVIAILCTSLLALASYLPTCNAEGTLVWTRTSNPSRGLDEAHGVARYGEYVYVVGHDYASGYMRWRIEKRSLSTGSLIWNRTSNPSSKMEEAKGVAVEYTGLYVVGYSLALGSTQWRIEKRSLSTGSLIWAQTSNPMGGIAYGVAVHSTGLYVVGKDYAPGNEQWRIEKRSLSTGSLIWTRTSNPSSTWDIARDVAVDSTGLYVVGHDYSDRWRIEKRSLSTGSLIWAQTSNPSIGNNDQAWGVAVHSTGLYVVGYEYAGIGSSRWRIEKRSLSTGSLIWTRTHTKATAMATGVACDVAFDSTGLYVVGTTYYSGYYWWRIEKRSLSTGSLIWATTSNPSSGSEADGVAVRPSGICVVGYASTPPTGWPPRGGDAWWIIESRTL